MTRSILILILLGAPLASLADNLAPEEPTSAAIESPDASVLRVVPNTIAFQGFLTDDGGTQIDGTVDLDLALYAAEVGGAPLWSESQNGVLVAAGVFAIALGDANPLPPAIFDGSELYLGISVDAEAELPRTQLRTSPYAFHAYDADQLGGLGSLDYVKRAGDTMVGTLGLDGGVTGLQTGGMTEVVASTTDVLLRRYYLEDDGGDSWSGRTGRIIFSSGGTGTPSAGGTGVATVSMNGATVATIALPSAGNRPWTYIVDLPGLGSGTTVDVAVRADSASDPVRVRSILFQVDDGGSGSGNTLDQAYDEGGAGAGRAINADAGAVEINGAGGLEVLGPIDAGAALGNDGLLRVFSLEASTPVVAIRDDNDGTGGSAQFYDTAGNRHTFIEPDIDGTGGFIGVFRNESASFDGIFLDGNGTGTEEPELQMFGSTRSLLLDMGQSGNNSVQLPSSSVSSSEILNEAGIAQGRVYGEVAVTGQTASMVDVVTVTLTIPSSGYIVLEASAQARFSGSTTGNYMAIQIDETAGGSTNDHYYYVGWASVAPAGIRWDPVSTRRTYFKTTGTYTFRLEARDANGIGDKVLWNPILTAQFFPTGYGSVSTVAEAGEIGLFQDVEHVSTGENGPGTVSTSVARVDLRELELEAARREAEAQAAARRLAEARLQEQLRR
jgi:hypothetical protein